MYHSLINYKRSKFEKFAVNILFSKENLIIDEKSLMEMLEVSMERAEYRSANKRKHRYRLKAMLERTKEIAIDTEVLNTRDLYRELKYKLLKVA